MVKAADIYKEILIRQGYDPNSEAAESVKRTLRNKMSFLVEQVALQKVSDFKEGNNVMIPDFDAPIVRNLIIASLDEEDRIIADWFNQSLDLDDALVCQCLYMSVKGVVGLAYLSGETDDVTVDEWMATIRGVINYDMAKNTTVLKNRLEEFRVRTLVKSSTVNNGALIVGFENGARGYSITPERKKPSLSNELLDKIVENLNYQEDYFVVLDQILTRMMDDAENKALPDIESYAIFKNAEECDNAKDLIPTDSMVSEYYPWLKKIGVFLKNKPDIAKAIEEKTNTENLIEFFE